MDIPRLDDQWKRDTINCLKESVLEAEDRDDYDPDVRGDNFHMDKYVM